MQAAHSEIFLIKPLLKKVLQFNVIFFPFGVLSFKLAPFNPDPQSLHRFESGAWYDRSSLSEGGLLSVTATRCFLRCSCLTQSGRLCSLLLAATDGRLRDLALPRTGLRECAEACAEGGRGKESDCHPGHFLEGCGGELAVHAADEGGGDAGGADGFAGVVI